MKDWKVDVPVLLIFFMRDEVLKKTFEAIREARPSILLLWQDGPREGREGDTNGIEKCRKIVENIDWDCKVYKNYHTENMGCDPSTFLAQKWAFSVVEKCIILEDDMVADVSFFSFCKELLDKYEFDERINHICGVNFLSGELECPNDYLFAYSGTGAWASWRRVAKGWDEDYSFLDKKYYIQQLKAKKDKAFDVSYEVAKHRKMTGKAYWESILGFDCMLNNRLVIISSKNLVSNIGMTEDSTHGTSNMKILPRSTRRLFFMKAEEMVFPIKHPEYIVPDINYINKMRILSGVGHPFRRFYRKCDYVFKCTIYGQFFRRLKAKLSRKRAGKGK